MRCTLFARSCGTNPGPHQDSMDLQHRNMFLRGVGNGGYGKRWHGQCIRLSDSCGEVLAGASGLSWSLCWSQPRPIQPKLSGKTWFVDMCLLWWIHASCFSCNFEHRLCFCYVNAAMLFFCCIPVHCQTSWNHMHCQKTRCRIFTPEICLSSVTSWVPTHFCWHRGVSNIAATRSFWRLPQNQIFESSHHLTSVGTGKMVHGPCLPHMRHWRRIFMTFCNIQLQW